MDGPEFARVPIGTIAVNLKPICRGRRSSQSPDADAHRDQRWVDPAYLSGLNVWQSSD